MQKTVIATRYFGREVHSNLMNETAFCLGHSLRGSRACGEFAAIIRERENQWWPFRPCKVDARRDLPPSFLTHQALAQTIIHRLFPGLGGLARFVTHRFSPLVELKVRGLGPVKLTRGDITPLIGGADAAYMLP